MNVQNELIWKVKNNGANIYKKNHFLLAGDPLCKKKCYLCQCLQVLPDKDIQTCTNAAKFALMVHCIFE